QLLPGLLHQLGGVVLFPRLAGLAQVGGERLLAPRHLAGRHYRRERRDAAVAARVAQGDHQRAVPAHRVPADRAHAAGRDVRLHTGRQLLHDVVVHAGVRGQGRLGGADVAAGALAQVVAISVGHALATRAGIRRPPDDAVL